jgi:hypothetical protein
MAFAWLHLDNLPPLKVRVNPRSLGHLSRTLAVPTELHMPAGEEVSNH